MQEEEEEEEDKEEEEEEEEEKEEGICTFKRLQWPYDQTPQSDDAEWQNTYLHQLFTAMQNSSVTNVNLCKGVVTLIWTYENKYYRFLTI